MTASADWQQRAFPAVLGALVLLHALWPSEAQWVNDEPLLIGNALAANSAHTLAAQGLMGTRGIAYGPLPTWLYQAYLFVSHDLVTLVALRALVVTGLTALAMAWLARTLNLWRWFAAAVLCSPFLWFYARTLWDNSFMVPIVAMAFAAYADFLKAPRTWTLLVTLGCLWALPMTHLMSLSLFVPFAVHLAWFSRKELLARKGPVLALLAVLTALSWTYIRYLASAQSSGGAAHAPADAWLFPLWGAQFISAFHIEQVLGAPWLWGHKTSIDQLAETLHTVSGIALVFSWLGFYFAARDLKAAWDKKSADPRTHLAGLCLAVAAGQAVLGGLSDRYGQPHYFNGTWFAYALLAWLAVDALLQRAPVQWLVGLQGAATLGVLLIIIFRTHDIGGSRENYGATLGNQLEVVRGLLKYAPSSRVSLEISQWQRFPHAFNVLRQLEPSPSSGSAVQQPNLRIAYVAPDPTDGRIQLVGP